MIDMEEEQFHGGNGGVEQTETTDAHNITSLSPVAHTPILLLIFRVKNMHPFNNIYVSSLPKESQPKAHTATIPSCKSRTLSNMFCFLLVMSVFPRGQANIPRSIWILKKKKKQGNT